MTDIGHKTCSTRPKQRADRKPWEYRPGSRAAFTHGCKCSTLPGLSGASSPTGVSLDRQPDGDGGYYYVHGPNCPSCKPKTTVVAEEPS